MIMRGIVVAGILAAAATWPAAAQPYSSAAQCQSIMDSQRRAACLNAVDRPPAPPPQPKTVRGRCSQNYCMWMRLGSQSVVASDVTGRLVRSMLERGETRYIDGNYDQPKPIDWGKPMDGYAFCSTTRPAVMYRKDGGGWVTDILAPGYPDAVYGANESSLIEYFLVCHGLTNVDVRDARLASRYGYPPELVDRAQQTELAAPADIMGRNVAVSPPASPPAQPPLNEAAMKAAAMNARACIRGGIAQAYAAGVYGTDQVTQYFLGRCLPAFAASMRALGFDNELAAVSLKVLVMQEIAPAEWQKATDELNRAARGGR
jgi:hypothetical protein